MTSPGNEQTLEVVQCHSVIGERQIVFADHARGFEMPPRSPWTKMRTSVQITLEGLAAGACRQSAPMDFDGEVATFSIVACLSYGGLVGEAVNLFWSHAASSDAAPVEDEMMEPATLQSMALIGCVLSCAPPRSPRSAVEEVWIGHAVMMGRYGGALVIDNRTCDPLGAGCSVTFDSVRTVETRRTLAGSEVDEYLAELDGR